MSNFLNIIFKILIGFNHHYGNFFKKQPDFKKEIELGQVIFYGVFVFFFFLISLIPIQITGMVIAIPIAIP